MDSFVGSYNSGHFCNVLYQIQKKVGPNHKWAVFMDNASYHRSAETKDYIYKHKISVILNAPYRPDVMGIEFFWREAKQKYRQHLTAAQVQGVNYDHLYFVRAVLEMIPDEQTKKYAKKGWEYLYAAKLVPAWKGIEIGQPLVTEEEVSMHHSQESSLMSVSLNEKIDQQLSLSESREDASMERKSKESNWEPWKYNQWDYKDL